MIRNFILDDLDAVAGIWLSSNLQAHAFIPAEYWRGNLESVKQQLPGAEVYVWEDPADGEIKGFIGLAGDYIAGIFVREDSRSKGLGLALLDHVKVLKERLSLSVYQENTRALSFYQREGFCICQESVDGDTGAREYFMTWER